MPATNSNRRRVQYSLRSLMLLVLAASLLLGYEVPPARRVERASAAIRAAGGVVEYEPRLSLFKYILGGSYGQRIVKASIPGQSVSALTPWLESLGDLRSVEVVYDGTCDLYPQFDELAAALPGKQVTATAASTAAWTLETSDFYQRLFRRLAEKIDGKTVYPLRRQPWDGYEDRDPFWRTAVPDFSYDLVTLDDGTRAEIVFANEPFAANVADAYPWLAILLVRDRVIDARHMSPGRPLAGILHDFDGDGVPEFAVECRRPKEDERPQGWKMPGDPRYWLNVFKIEPTGFRSILKRPPLEKD